MPEQPVPAQPEPETVELQIELPSDLETGIFADFANIWHTPNTFVLDFISVKRPPIPSEGENPAVLPAKVAARVRIPPEQIFPLIEALRTQSAQWLTESGRSEPPLSWVPPQPPIDEPGTLEAGEGGTQ